MYLDETWYDSHSCKMKNWTDDTENCHRLMTTEVGVSDKKGERIVIMHCGGCFGFLEDALFVTLSKMENGPADYHGSMNGAIFEKWFENCVLKRLERSSVIVLDNASYHSRILDPSPRSAWKKNDIIAYMRNNNVEIPELHQ